MNNQKMLTFLAILCLGFGITGCLEAKVEISEDHDASDASDASDWSDSSDTSDASDASDPSDTETIEIVVQTQSDSDYGESSWKIVNSGGSTVASGSPTGANLTEETFHFLSDDSYCLIVEDTYGDGGMRVYADWLAWSGECPIIIEGTDYTSRAEICFDSTRC